MPRRPPPSASPAPAAAPSPKPAVEAPALAYFVIFNPTLVREPERRETTTETGEDDSVQRGSEEGKRVDAGTPDPDSDREGVQAAPESPTTPKATPIATPAATTTPPPQPDSPAHSPAPDPGERDRDLEDDLREAAQIVFYTNTSGRSVSRDTMLRQVGLAKGLMGFADMVSTPGDDPFWAVHSQHARLVVYCPEPGWYIYICISATAPCALSDRMLVSALERGYDDFCLLHGPFDANTSSASQPTLEKFWTRFALSFESSLVPSLTHWLGGQPAPALPPAELGEFAALLPSSEVGLLSRSGPLSAPDLDARPGAALTRLLLGILAASPQPPPPRVEERQALGFGWRKPEKEGLVPEKKDDRKTSWGLWGLMSRAPTPAPKDKEKDREKEKGKDSQPTVSVSVSTPASPAKAQAQDTPRRAVSHAPTASASSLASVASVASGASAASASSRRWALAEVMGSMGAALGLSPAPSPRIPEGWRRDGRGKGGEGEGKSGEGEDEEGGDGEGKSGSDTEETESVEIKDKDPDAEAEAKSESDTRDTSPRDLHDPPDPAPPVAAEGAEAMEAALLGTSLQSYDAASLTSLEPERTPPSPPTPTPTAPAGLAPALEEARGARVDVSWASRAVFTPERSTLSWAVRGGALLYVLGEAPGDSKAVGDAAVRVFSAISEEKKEEKDVVQKDTTVYHFGETTSLKGSLYGADGALSALRDVILGGVGEVVAQLPSGRFVVGKRASDGAELYVVTARREASLTDAERAVRAFAVERPEFS